MLAKSLEDEETLLVDERLATVVRIIVEQYHGDVRAFVESIRYRVQVSRKAQTTSNHGDERASQTLSTNVANARP